MGTGGKGERGKGGTGWGDIQPSEAGFNPLLIGVEGETEDLVEIGVLPYPVVGFVDCVEEIGEDDGGLDYSPVLQVSGGAGLGLWIACSDGDAIVNGLNPA